MLTEYWGFAHFHSSHTQGRNLSYYHNYLIVSSFHMDGACGWYNLSCLEAGLGAIERVFWSLFALVGLKVPLFGLWVNLWGTGWIPRYPRDLHLLLVGCLRSRWLSLHLYSSRVRMGSGIALATETKNLNLPWTLILFLELMQSSILGSCAFVSFLWYGGKHFRSDDNPSYDYVRVLIRKPFFLT